MSDLDAAGIRVDVNQAGRMPRTMRFVVPLGGARIEDDGVVIEVCPNVEMPQDRWRNHDQVEALADKVEGNGGFMWQGDNIGVGGELIVGRDALRLLTTLWKRAEERNTEGEGLKAARKQGEEAARRQTRDELKAVAAKT